MKLLRKIAILTVCIFACVGLWTKSVKAQVTSPPPYQSEIQQQCIDEMARDARILAACERQYTNDLHAQDARQATMNNRHVVMVYVAILIILVIFMVSMWLRQRKLIEEIAVLEAKLDAAAAQ